MQYKETYIDDSNTRRKYAAREKPYNGRYKDEYKNYAKRSCYKSAKKKWKTYDKDFKIKIAHPPK